MFVGLLVELRALWKISARGLGAAGQQPGGLAGQNVLGVIGLVVRLIED